MPSIDIEFEHRGVKFMKHFFLLCLSSLLATSTAVGADSTVSAPTAAVESSESSTSTSGGVLKKFEESSVITDAKLKADAGSLSRVSLKANLAYYGPPVDNFGNKDQPNPDGVVSATKTAVSGSLGARYRFDPVTTISMGAGVKNNYPFHTGQKLTMSNPYASYDKSFRVAGVQMVASPGLTLVTEEAYRNVGERWGISNKFNAVYNLGMSGFAVGSDNTLAYYFFDRDYKQDIPATKTKKMVRGDGAVQRISLTIAPNLKYNLTSKLSAITSLGFTFFNPRSESNRLEYRSRLMNQRLGVGYAVTREIYLNPYVQFYPTQFSWNTATANISTVFSIL